MITNIKSLYKKGIRTSLIAQDNLTSHLYHLFSVIELLPADIPDYKIPDKDWHANKSVRSRNSSGLDTYSFYLTINTIETIDQALHVFNAPVSNTRIDENDILFFNKAFIKEPGSDFPLIFGSNIFSDDSLASVLPKRHSGFYAWAQIDHNREVYKHFQQNSVSKDMKAMSQLTNEWLGFDIWSKSEHLGNIYLTAPNPYFRDIDISLCNNPTGIFYQIKARKGINDKFIFRIIDKHGDAIALDKTVNVSSYKDLIILPHEPQLFELKVYNEQQNLIYIHGPSAFLKRIQIGMSVKQADFHVKAETAKGNREFVVEKYSKEIPSIVGNAPEFNAGYYFKQAENQRQHVKLKNSKEFIFFPGGKSEQEKTNLKSEAKEVIREIINHAKDSCYMCDPYFNSIDLIDYAFHIRSSGTEIRIINSKEFINKDEAKKMVGVINQYNNKPFGKIDVRVLRGDSILHDRFVIADLNVWFIGSSFNEIGKRATCLAKVPDSSNIEIIKEVEKWFFNDEFTQNIEEYSIT